MIAPCRSFLHMLVCMAILLTAAAPAAAQQQRLRIGDQAPGLDVEQWVSGSAVGIESGRVYVVTFWATSSPPSTRAMPILSRLQNQYGDRLQIIGVSSEQPGVVRTFFNQNRERMQYAVAIDRQQGTTRAWMQAAGRTSTPSAFIVDRRGRVQFIGSPLDSNFEDVVSRVVSGRYDARLFEQAQRAIQAARTARQLKNFRLAIQHFDQLIETDRTVFASFALEKFEMKLLDMNDRAAAYVYARSLLETYADDADLLIDLSAKIAADDKLSSEHRDLDVAMAAAQAAVALLSQNDPRRYSARALVLYHRGDVDEAVRLQRQAWRMARPDEKPRFRQDLDMFQAGAARQQQAGSGADR